MIIVLGVLMLTGSTHAYGKKIHDKAHKFKMEIPGTMLMVKEDAGANEQLYFDTAKNIVLIISGRISNFKSVHDYIDCSNLELEQKLQVAFGDSSLQLVSCVRSKYYPGKTAVVHFYLTDNKNGLNTYVVYFVHDKNEDLQFSFAYPKESEQQSIAYVDGIMQTFKLK
jgi:hypothetical protein